MEPKVKMWIDAQKEELTTGDFCEINYVIENLEQENVKLQVYQLLSFYVKGLVLISPDTLQVTYDTSRITPSFIDYLLSQKNINFRRQGG
ncbi:hypothetical protein RDV78_04220 [Bacillota bacterium LX-D]|nr:hypothetical protein [Bacillota bacterium LX-D]